MCKLCDNINFSGDTPEYIAHYEELDTFYLVLPSWDCYNDVPDEYEYEIKYCPECGVNLKEKYNL